MYAMQIGNFEFINYAIWCMCLLDLCRSSIPIGLMVANIHIILFVVESKYY